MQAPQQSRGYLIVAKAAQRQGAIVGEHAGIHIRVCGAAPGGIGVLRGFISNGAKRKRLPREIVEVRFQREKMLPLAEVARIVACGIKVAQRLAGFAAPQRIYTQQQMRRDVLTRGEPFTALPWMETA